MAENVAGSKNFLSYQREFREKAASSLDDLRGKLNFSPAKSPSWSKMSQTRSPNAYSASVDRLKDMLKKYETMKNSDIEQLQKDRHNQSTIPQPDELVPLFDDQHSLMQHLESQVLYYKNALDTLKQKADIVIDENSRLHEELRCQVEEQINDISDLSTRNEHHISVKEIGIQAELLEFSKTDTASNQINQLREDQIKQQCDPKTMKSDLSQDATEETVEDRFATPGKIDFGELNDEMMKMKNVYSSKSKHIEGLLKSAREELDEKQKQINMLQSQLWKQNITSRETDPNETMICVKCAHNQAVLSKLTSDGSDRVLQRIQRENMELSDTVTKQSKMIENLRRKELEAYVQVKKSCEMAEQIQLEKHEVNVCLQQSKQELERLKEQNRNQLSKSNDHLKKEKLKLQHDHEETLGSLNKKLDETVDALSRSELQFERATREKVELKAALVKMNEGNLVHDSDMEKRLTELRLELAEVCNVRTLLKQKNQMLQQENKALESMEEKKLGWSTSELNQLKKRLLQTEQNLESCKDECVKLTECLQDSTKQVQIEKAARIQQERTYVDQIKQTRISKTQSEDQLQMLLRETEGKHEAATQELGGLLESQMKIANRFKLECEKLAERLEEVEKSHNQDISKLINENSSLKNEIEGISKQNKDLKTAENDARQKLESMEKAMNTTELQLKKNTEKAISLMNKYNAVLRERQLLCDEIEFLRAQLPGFRHSDKISISDLDSTEKTT
eukprot:gene19996-21955_t